MSIKGKTYLVASILLTFIMAAIFTLTSPDNVGISFLLMPVIIFFLLLFSILNFIFLNISNVGPRERFLSSFAVAAGATLLTVLSSIGSLTVYDLLVLVIFIVVSTIYLRKNIK